MKTLLIVEDEKMIRQGISIMVKRSKVSVEEVLECRNGAEAMEILKNHPVDAMFTDIRMPKMDGIDLVKNVKMLEKRPKIIVISGYDDFNYAVEMLKNGVEDYILKPVKREKIEEILEKLEKQIKEVEQAAQMDACVFGKLLLRCLKEETVSPSELTAAAYKFQQYAGENAYYAVLSGADDCVLFQEDTFLELEDEGQRMRFVRAREDKEIPRIGASAGISKIHKTFDECAKAYQEAMAARTHAWVCVLAHCTWEESIPAAGGRIQEDFALRFARMLPAQEWKNAVNQYRNLAFQARHGQLMEGDFVLISRKLIKELKRSYGGLLDEEDRFPENPLCMKDAEEYMEAFLSWVQQIRSMVDKKYDGSRNQNKIRQAEEYIRENFRKDLNMAMVSNYVSMNYSLFSNVFKEYTGVNFVAYLKNLRIEEAKRLLTDTDEKVQDIGKAAGFENDKNFLKSFKAVCGVSPTEYRRNEEFNAGLPETGVHPH